MDIPGSTRYSLGSIPFSTWKGRTTSDLSHTATTDASAGDHPLHPLVIGLRQRHAKLTLGRLGLFRSLEWMIARWSGAQPQRNDHEWLRRFGRKVIGRRRAA